jgi:6-phosphogluconate dehydrogenase
MSDLNLTRPAVVNLKDTSWVRWPVLALACLMLIGSYYSAEMPAALKQQLEDYFG